MAEIDHFEVNTYGNTTYVEPKYREGCGTKIGVVVFILLLSIILKLCGAFDSSTSNQEETGPASNRPTLSQGNADSNDSEQYPDRMNLADLYVHSEHSEVVDNIRIGTVTDPFGETYQGPYFALTSIQGSNLMPAYTEVVTGGEYMYLSGTYFADAKYSSYEITFQIYADGVLVYDSGKITRDNQATKFDVCINHAQLVKVYAVASNVDVTQAAHLILVNAEVRK